MPLKLPPKIAPAGGPIGSAFVPSGGGPRGGRALGPSRGFWAPLVVLSWVGFALSLSLASPRLKRGFLSGFFGYLPPPLFSRVLSREKANFGPRKAEPEAEPERRKSGAFIALSCALESPLPPRGRVIFKKVEGPLFAGGLPEGWGQTRGKKAPPPFYSTSGKT